MSDKIVHPYILNVFIALSLLQVSSGTGRNVKFKESKSKDIFDAVAAWEFIYNTSIKCCTTVYNSLVVAKSWKKEQVRRL